MSQLFIEKYPKETLRALSWKQPFASLMRHGKVETRTWDSKYFGWVLICASQKPYSHVEVQDISGEKQWERITNVLGFDFKSSPHIPLGKAIAVGKLYQSELMDSKMINPPQSVEDNKANLDMHNAIEFACFVNPASGLWMHHYMDVQPIEHFDWKGTQSWSTVSEDVKSKIVLL